MLVKYGLPLTSKRADVVFAGVHPRTGEDSYVVIELKQWSRSEPTTALVQTTQRHRSAPSERRPT
jgi:uncharacterized protein